MLLYLDFLLYSPHEYNSQISFIIKAFNMAVESGISSIADENLIEYAWKVSNFEKSTTISEYAFKLGINLEKQGKLSTKAYPYLLNLAISIAKQDELKKFENYTNDNADLINRMLSNQLSTLKLEQALNDYADAFSLHFCNKVLINHIDSRHQLFLKLINDGIAEGYNDVINKLLDSILANRKKEELLQIVDPIEWVVCNSIMLNNNNKKMIGSYIQVLHKIVKIYVAARVKPKNEVKGIIISLAKLLEDHFLYFGSKNNMKNAAPLTEIWSYFTMLMHLANWGECFTFSNNIVKFMTIRLLIILNEAILSAPSAIVARKNITYDENSYDRISYGMLEFKSVIYQYDNFMMDNPIINSGLMSPSVIYDTKKVQEFTECLLNLIYMLKIEKNPDEQIININKLLSNFFSEPSEKLFLKYCCLNSLDFAHGLISFMGEHNDKMYDEFMELMNDVITVSHLITFTDANKTLKQELENKISAYHIKSIYSTNMLIKNPLEVPALNQIATNLKSKAQVRMLEGLSKSYNIFYGAVYFPFVFDVMLMGKTTRHTTNYFYSSVFH